MSTTTVIKHTVYIFKMHFKIQIFSLHSKIKKKTSVGLICTIDFRYCLFSIEEMSSRLMIVRYLTLVAFYVGRLGGWKMRDRNARAENAGPSSMESYLAIKCANGILMLCQPDISFSALSTVITNRTQRSTYVFEYNVSCIR